MNNKVIEKFNGGQINRYDTKDILSETECNDLVSYYKKQKYPTEIEYSIRYDKERNCRWLILNMEHPSRVPFRYQFARFLNNLMFTNELAKSLCSQLGHNDTPVYLFALSPNVDISKRLKTAMDNNDLLRRTFNHTSNVVSNIFAN